MALIPKPFHKEVQVQVLMRHPANVRLDFLEQIALHVTGTCSGMKELFTAFPSTLQVASLSRALPTINVETCHMQDVQTPHASAKQGNSESPLFVTPALMGLKLRGMTEFPRVHNFYIYI